MPLKFRARMALSACKEHGKGRVKKTMQKYKNHR
uniref:Uncharacterized protein n=1 Tax=Arundo donax TaxID=35708 RepID=A0A0A9G034_ARUDO